MYDVGRPPPPRTPPRSQTPTYADTDDPARKGARTRTRTRRARTARTARIRAAEMRTRAPAACAPLLSPAARALLLLRDTEGGKWDELLRRREGDPGRAPGAVDLASRPK
eukprot:gene16574-55303_t